MRAVSQRVRNPDCLYSVQPALTSQRFPAPATPALALLVSYKR
jgi:hypothetical protein